jgi:hypothetical protein
MTARFAPSHILARATRNSGWLAVVISAQKSATANSLSLGPTTGGGSFNGKLALAFRRRDEGCHGPADAQYPTRLRRQCSRRDLSSPSSPSSPWYASRTGLYFGGPTIVRQGFAAFQVQGVEFRQLGEGGKLGHHPQHFHLARKTPPNTFVKDSPGGSRSTGRRAFCCRPRSRGNRRITADSP